MKSVIVCSLLLTTTTLAVGQNTGYPEKKEQPYFKRLEKETLGKDQGFFKKIAREIRYPATAQQATKVGKMYAEFMVDREGKITNVSVMNEPALDSAFVQEVVCTMNALPEQNPAYVGAYVLPVTFQLEDKNGGTTKALEADLVAVSEALKTKFVLQDTVIVGYK